MEKYADIWLGNEAHHSYKLMLQHLCETGLEVKRCGPVWHTGTSLAAWKAYRHFFLRKVILVCIARSFLIFWQLVAEILHQSLAKTASA